MDLTLCWLSPVCSPDWWCCPGSTGICVLARSHRLGKEMLNKSINHPTLHKQWQGNHLLMEEIYPKSPKIILSKTIPSSHFHISPPSLPALRVSVHSLSGFILFPFSLVFSPGAPAIQDGGLGSCAQPMQGIPCSPLPSLE